MSKFCPFYEVVMPELKLGYCPFNFGEKHIVNESRKSICPAGYQRSAQKKNSLCPYGFKNGSKNIGQVTATYIGKGKKLCPFYGTELPSKIGYCPTGMSFPGQVFEKDVCPLGYRSKEAGSVKECPFGYKHEENTQGSCPYGYDKMNFESKHASHGMLSVPSTSKDTEGGSCPYGYDKMGSGDMPLSSHSKMSHEMPSTSKGAEEETCPFGYDKMASGGIPENMSKELIDKYSAMFAQGGGSCPYGYDKYVAFDSSKVPFPKSTNFPKKKLSKKKREALKKKRNITELADTCPYGYGVPNNNDKPMASEEAVCPFGHSVTKKDENEPISKISLPAVELSEVFCPFYKQHMPKLKLGYCPFNLGSEKHKINDSRKTKCPAGYERTPEEANSLCPYGYKNGQRNTGEVSATYIGKGKKFCPFYGVELNSIIGYCPTGNSFPGAFFEKNICPLGYQAKAESVKECPFGYKHEEKKQGSCPYGYDKMGSGGIPPSSHSKMSHGMPSTSKGAEEETCPFGYDKMASGGMPENMSKELIDKYSAMFAQGGGSCPYGYDKMLPGTNTNVSKSAKKKLSKKKRDILRKKALSLNTDSQSLAKATENSINFPAAQTSSNSEVEIEKKTPVGKCPFGHG